MARNLAGTIPLLEGDSTWAYCFMVTSPFFYYGFLNKNGCLITCVEIQVVLTVMQAAIFVPACVHVGRGGEFVFAADHGFVMFLRIMVFFSVIVFVYTFVAVINMIRIFGKGVGTKRIQHVVQCVHVIVCPIMAVPDLSVFFIVRIVHPRAVIGEREELGVRRNIVGTDFAAQDKMDLGTSMESLGSDMVGSFNLNVWFDGNCHTRAVEGYRPGTSGDNKSSALAAGNLIVSGVDVDGADFNITNATTATGRH